LENRQYQLYGSASAIGGGILLLLTLTSSLYHLAFMSLQRFCAVQWPLKWRLRSWESDVLGIVAVWVLAIISATFPGTQAELKILASNTP